MQALLARAVRPSGLALRRSSSASASASASAFAAASAAASAASKGIRGSLLAWAAAPPLQRGRMPVGASAEIARAFDARAVAGFAALAGDDNPVHLDAAFAKGTRFGAPIVHGMLAASLWGTLLGASLPGCVYVSQAIAFKAPVFVGETVTACVVAARRAPSPCRHSSRRAPTLPARPRAPRAAGA